MILASFAPETSDECQADRGDCSSRASELKQKIKRPDDQNLLAMKSRWPPCGLDKGPSNDCKIFMMNEPSPEAPDPQSPESSIPTPNCLGLEGLNFLNS